MKEYHKIQTCFKRDHKTNYIIEYDWTSPEFEYLKNNQWVFTEKVDGTNVRIMWDGKNITFGGKTDNAQMPISLIYKLQELFEGTSKKQLFNDKFGDSEICLYGEGYGAKIQKGENYIKDGVSFVLFDVKIGNWWLQRKDVEDISQYLGIDIVPIIGEGPLVEAVEITRQGKKSQWGDFISEGIVARPKTELKTRDDERIITKIKHRDFSKK